MLIREQTSSSPQALRAQPSDAPITHEFGDRLCLLWVAFRLRKLSPMVLTIEQIDQIENEYVLDRKPVLQPSFDALLDRWCAGCRDQETVVRLLFLGWLTFAEANFLTGLAVENFRPALFAHLLETLGGEDIVDPELLFVISIMTQIVHQGFGNEADWETLGETFTARLGDKLFNFDPAIFRGRGAYGSYFSGQAEFQKKYHEQGLVNLLAEKTKH